MSLYIGPVACSSACWSMQYLSYSIILYSVIKLYMVDMKGPDNSQTTFDMLYFSERII